MPVGYGGRRSTYRASGRIMRTVLPAASTVNKKIQLMRSIRKFGAPIAMGGLSAGSVIKSYGRNRASRLNNTIFQKGNEIGRGGSESSFYYTSRKIPRGFPGLKGALSDNYYVINAAGRLGASVGTQNSVIANRMFNTTDLQTISTSVGGANSTVRWLARKCSSETMITNQDSGNCRITIYDIIARRDSNSSVNTSDPVVAWNNSYLDEGGANANSALVGTLPFSSDLFTQFFKVLKVTTILLGAGQTHFHRISFKLNKVIDQETVKYVTSSLKGTTCYQMVVVSGVPYNDVTTTTQVSTGACNVDWVSRREYKYTWLADNTTTFSSSNNLPGSFTVAEDIMDIASGVKTADAPA